MVIAIIGILIGLLLPAVQAAREASRRMQCANNLKQLGLGLHNYHTALNCFPPGFMAVNHLGQVRGGWAWGVFLMPFLEQCPLQDTVESNEVHLVSSHLRSAAPADAPDGAVGLSLSLVADGKTP